MPAQTRVPADEDWRSAILVGCRTPSERFGDEVPRHGSPPADEARRTVVETVPGFIDHEAEAANAILVGRYEVAALLGRTAVAAEARDALRHTRMLIRPERRNHDPIGGMFLRSEERRVGKECRL